MNTMGVFSIALFAALLSFAPGDVVINELHYNPLDGALDEFIELYNPTASPIDLKDYDFSAGLSFTFPSGTVIQPKGYLVLVRDPSRNVWRGKTYSKVGPYEGKLANDGEKITLRAPDGRVIDSLDYDDDPPWPRGADGYGASLERISPDLPSQDFHSWRASLTEGGTPGELNSVSGCPPRPVIVAIQFVPGYPISSEEVYVDVSLDGPELIHEVALRIEPWTNAQARPLITLPMSLVQQDGNIATYRALIAPYPSQTLVRVGVEVTRSDGKRVRLPHAAEPRPFESYFVYDGEIPSKLPILWIFPAQRTALLDTAGVVSGAVVKPVTSDRVLVYDGARVRNSLIDNSGRKIVFLKGEEYRGDRTINISPESPIHPNTGGPRSNHVEHIAFQIFRDLGVLTPRCDWYRVVENGQHTQCIATQQPNERFLAINGRDDTGNIYKVAYQEKNAFPNGYSSWTRYTKKTNVDEGDDDLIQLSDAIHSADPVARAKALRRFLVVEEVMAYSVAGVLISNWDGFFNNMFLCHNPPPIDRWECIPWDLDKTFGYTDGYPPHDTMFVEMPLTFPLDGRARLAAREPGPISKPFHMDEELNKEYLNCVRRELDGLFSINRVDRLAREAETVLLEDLELLEQHIGQERPVRRTQIQDAYSAIRTFVRLRQEYLWKHLPASVDDWAVK
jgi:hypothetical protein